MMFMTALPLSYDWLRILEPQLKELDKIPLTGNAPAFAWDKFSEHLRQLFELNSFSIQPGEMAWRTKEEINQGNSAYYSLYCTVPPLKGNVYWMFPKQAVSHFIHLLLTPKVEEAPFQEDPIQQGFFHFIALEAIFCLTKFLHDKTLTPLLCEKPSFPNEDALCWDISLHFGEHLFGSRLILPPIFQQSWVAHFAHQEASSALTQKMQQLVAILMDIEVGYIYLTIVEWKKIELGDFIILDHCSLNIDRLEGKVLLAINGKQAFRAKLKEGNLKILEFPSLQEVHAPMVEEPDDEEEISDLDFSESFEEFEDENLFETDDNFEDLEERLIVAGDSLERNLHEMSSKIESQENTSKPVKNTTEKKPHIVAAYEVPLKITVIIGSIEIPLEKLLQLEPGNLLDTDFRPENGVDLTLNGKIIGKGELLRVGEAIGVRVLELGK
jgi:flagellar motor switch protein FliN/FliY